MNAIRTAYPLSENSFCKGTPRARAFGVGLIVLTLSACNTGREEEVRSCPNLAQAQLVLGQRDFISNQSNRGSSVSSQGVSGPLGAATGDGTLFYLPDTLNNRILGFVGPTIGNGGAASFVLGQADHNSAAAGGGSNGLLRPGKVSISTDGTRLIVADSGNNRVLIWNSLPSSNLPPDLVLGQTGFQDADGRNLGQANAGARTPSAGTLSNPVAATIANDKLFVVDKGNNRILIWNTVPTANGSPADLELGQTASDATKGTCSSNTGETGYCFGTGLANVDQASPNNGPLDLRLNQPSDLITDGVGYLVVSDTLNNRVLFWNSIPSSNNAFPNFVLGQPGTNGGPSFGQAGSGSGTQRMSAPWGLHLDTTHLYVADSGNNRVLAFTGIPLIQNAPPATGLFGQAAFSGTAFNDADQNGSPGDQRLDELPSGVTAATLHAPTGLFGTSDGALYVTDRNNNRVLRFARTDAVNGTRPDLCSR